MWIYSDSLDIAYVPVCKAACTSITAAILVDAGVLSDTPNHPEPVHRMACYPMSKGYDAAIVGGRVVSARDARITPGRWFSFVRHPLARLVSCYQDKVVHDRPGLPPALRVRPFGAFVRAVCDTSRVAPMHLNPHVRPQVHTLRERQYDLVGKVENIAEDWGRLCRLVGRDLPLSCLNKCGDGNGWREHYDGQTLGIAADFFKDDLERFGYSIGEVA